MNNKKPKVSIANLLYRHSPRLLVFAVVVGALAGALYSLIIPFVLRQLNGASGADAYPVGLFFAVCVAILLTKAASVILVNNIAKTATAELRIGIARKINKMMIDNVEGVGFARLLNILIDDVNNVAAAGLPGRAQRLCFRRGRARHRVWRAAVRAARFAGHGLVRKGARLARRDPGRRAGPGHGRLRAQAQ
jgi:ABC-type multidrug transport system fused ATPase/permease subunit